MRWLCLDFVKVVAGLVCGLVKGALFGVLGAMAGLIGGTIILFCLLFILTGFGAFLGCSFEFMPSWQQLSVFATIVTAGAGFLYGLFTGFRNAAERLELW